MYSNSVRELKIILGNELKLIFRKLIEISGKNRDYFEKIKSTLFLYRLLKCKWNQL
jgi:hypothetical protein